MNKDFYRAFEDKYRGPRELIKSRLQVYLPFVELLKMLDGRFFAVDLGSGRGEWLELLRDAGIVAHGIDLNQGMLDDCLELGLSVEVGEAISHLKKLPDESHNTVSAFHLAEHLPFDELQTLVQEALRVLKPAGILILETPNPENIVVATRKFYVDPTHLRPIPSQLLSFLPEFYGYARTKVLRLQESQELTQNMSPALNDVFAGVSPDYAVIAQKTAPEKILSLFDEVFNQEYGLSFDTLAGRFDARLQQAEEKAGEAAGRASEAESRAQQAEEKAGQAETIARQALDVARHAEAVGQRAEEQLSAIYNSRSWRMTQPLRAAANAVRWFKRGTIAWLTFAPASRPRRFVRKVVIHLKLYVFARPRLKVLVLRLLAFYPRLKARLKMVGSQPQPVQSTLPIDKLKQIPYEKPEHLSPRARQIYDDLKAAIEQHKKGQS